MPIYNKKQLNLINKFITSAIKDAREELKLFNIIDIYDHFNQYYLDILNNEYNIYIYNECWILQLINKKYQNIYKKSLLNLIDIK